MTEEKLQRAKQVLASCCQALDQNDWKYQLDEEDFSIEFGAKGEDLPIRLIFKVDAEREVVLLFSPQQFDVPTDKALEIAIALSVINNRLVDGSFDYNLTEESNICFRMTQSYRGSTIGSEVFEYMAYCACSTVDNYNDKLLMIVKGILPLEKFLNEFAN